MKAMSLSPLFFLPLLLILANLAYGGSESNLDPSGIGLKGYDPVSYFKGIQPLKGDPKIQAKVEETTYLFANATDKLDFLKEPKKYIPQFGGWCAFAVADSKAKVDVDPNSFIIQDGRLLLFYKGLWGNTREKWLHTKTKDSVAFLREADQNWPDVKKKEP